VSAARKQAFAHAVATTGTLLWTPTGVYSGDGRKSLERAYRTSQATQDFVSRRALRFTRPERERAQALALAQVERLKRYAKAAIDAGKLRAAARLCEMAEHREDAVVALGNGTRVLYRII
jgi:hypothetical protein